MAQKYRKDSDCLGQHTLFFAFLSRALTRKTRSLSVCVLSAPGGWKLDCCSLSCVWLSAPALSCVTADTTRAWATPPSERVSSSGVNLQVRCHHGGREVGEIDADGLAAGQDGASRRRCLPLGAVHIVRPATFRGSLQSRNYIDFILRWLKCFKYSCKSTVGGEGVNR